MSTEAEEHRTAQRVKQRERKVALLDQASEAAYRKDWGRYEEVRAEIVQLLKES